MPETHSLAIANQVGTTQQQVEAVKSLLDAGATIPFIARYRKEKTGSLDEVVITEIRDGLERLAALDARRQVVLKSLEDQNVLTAELRSAVEAAATLTALEDIYLPYRPKRRTRATVAREKGLEPLADLVFAQNVADPSREALAYVNAEKGVGSVEDALAGARDIIAERVNEDAPARQLMRSLFYREGVIQTSVVKGKEAEGAKYANYFDWQDPVARVPGHRMLAMLRGENEGVLRLKIRPPEEKAESLLHRRFVKGTGAASAQVVLAIEDGYSRLLAPSIETDIRQQAKERADDDALRVFGRNLHETLMAPPLGPRAVLAIDPGYRTGCKVVCLDPQGKLLANAVIYVDQSAAQSRSARQTILGFIERFHIEAIAIGNGTASRETEEFIRGLDLPDTIPVVMVNESGASIYSASAVAREEFPDQDITVRGAVSIGRRLQDPLAELVKIDPKSIGVGQYQHDVDQGKLKSKLDETVMSSVNEVGVKVNTASRQLLTYVSGLGPALAKNVVGYRDENGPFRSRAELKKVPRLGPKAFELAAGFLRVDSADNPLDASAVHPESYHLVERMAGDMDCSVSDLMRREDLRRRINLESYAGEEYGLPTLQDIMVELAKPGRDPREQFEAVSFDKDVRTIDRLAPGMQLTGIVTNVTNFGAFVDIGVHQDGLVHISELSDKFVKNPADVVKVNQKVSVTVLAVDPERKRIGLSMRPDAAQRAAAG
ncbi:MAG: RNA-binding transcriptional accessory protein [Chloroflexi bacterium RBG_16_57_8]|nr:MAG: RNA-binding transcriptional accessory protein [Chloroflexi bacterium RBG_16_57_8]